MVGISLASYSLVWESGNRETWAHTASNLYRTGRFVLNPEERARRISDVITNADISFCKSFWGLTEGPLLQVTNHNFAPSVRFRKIFLFRNCRNGFVQIWR